MTTDPELLTRVYTLLDRGSGVHWMAKSPTGHAAVGSISTTPDHFVSRAARQAGWDFYVTLNPSARSCIKPNKQDISTLSCIGIDIDAPLTGPMDKQKAATALSTALGAMTGVANSHIIIDSGRGIWAWLFVDPQPLEDEASRESADQLIKGFTEALSVQHPDIHTFGHLDSSCAELSRLARCPGTINHRSGTMANICMDFYPIQTVEHSVLKALAHPYIEGVSLPQPPIPVTGSSLFDIAPHMNLTSRQFVLTGVTAPESRHRRLFSSAKNLFELKVPEDLAEYMLWSGASRCIPDLNRADPGCVRRIILQIWKKRRTA